MAAINEVAEDSRRPGYARQKKASLRIDMTPMVDLGFLLITFFIFTTSITGKKSMFLIMPDDHQVSHPNLLKEGLALTLLVDKNNGVYYYHGDFDKARMQNAIFKTNYSVYKGIGEVIRAKQKAIDASGNYKEGRNGIMLLIKPAPGASYKNMVDALDETLINNLKKYAITEPSAAELDWLESNEK